YKVNREIQYPLARAGGKRVVSILEVGGALAVKEVLAAHVIMRQAVRPYPGRPGRKHRIGPGLPPKSDSHAHPGDEGPVGSRSEILVVGGGTEMEWIAEQHYRLHPVRYTGKGQVRQPRALALCDHDLWL